ncbi:MAG: GNAT family N-acetyltransferase [Lachnospiraceae bacterium]|nr:GNAT family N-acetyltransferase [Lachnospiraceae bacterium]
MTLTGIGPQNADAFRHLCGILDYEDYTVCVGAIEDGRAAGVAFFSELGDALFIDYIYVAENFRRRGIGTALIEQTIRELAGVPLVALHVNYPESAEDIHRFILSLGFRIFRDGTAYRTKVSDMLGSNTAKKLFAGKMKNRVARLSSLTTMEKKMLKRKLDEAEADPDVIEDHLLSPELSLITFDSISGVPAGLVLCRLEEKTIVLSYLINFSQDPVMLLDILKGLRNTVASMDLSDHDLVFLTLTDDMLKLPEKLLESPDLIHNEGSVISGIRMFS